MLSVSEKPYEASAGVYIGVRMRKWSKLHDLGLVAELGHEPLVLIVHRMTLRKSSFRPQLLYSRLSIKKGFRIQI